MIFDCFKAPQGELKRLAQLFPSTLYIVGGAVRDELLGYRHFDLDLTAALTPVEVSELLLNTEFRVYATAPKLGTLKIKSGVFEAEYTTFRVDSYSLGHTPEEVVFTDDINKDARRRDFSVNAIYYDLKKDELVDPLSGLADIDNKLLRTADAPDKTLAEDGLRILRMIRLSAELGFGIEAKTLQSAKNNLALLKDIAPERIRDELVKILVSDTKNNIKDTHYYALCLMTELGMWDYTVPELVDNIGFPQNPTRHSFDVFTHILHTVKYSPPEIRVAALFHDCAKALCQKRDGNMHSHAECGATITEQAMQRLKFSKKEIAKTVRLVRTHMEDIDCNTGEKKLRNFIQSNADIINDIIALKQADHFAKGFGLTQSPSAVRLEKVVAEMKKEGVPFTIAELKIDGTDLIREGVLAERRADLLAQLLKEAATNATLLTREGQLFYIKSRA